MGHALVEVPRGSALGGSATTCAVSTTAPGVAVTVIRASTSIRPKEVGGRGRDKSRGVAVPAIAIRRPESPARSGSPAAAATRTPSNSIRWLADTGSGHDLIARSDLPKRMVRRLKDAERPLHLCTANGSTSADKVAEFSCDALKSNINAYVLESTPPVVSIGRRCMEEDFAFH